jgi:hypothetical protein
MTPSDAASLLAVASSLDPRLTPPSKADGVARATVWSAALDDDIPVDKARGIIVMHYRESTEAIMPAHVNRAWRQHRKQFLEAERRDMDAKAAAQQAAIAVPMPESIRQHLRVITGELP